MRNLKLLVGLIGALVPVCYCGYLLYYFYDVAGSVQEAQEIGLGPTLLGLGVVGLLFCIPVIIKLVKLLSGPPSPESGGGNSESEFDAEAAVARYMARQSAKATAAPASASPSAPPARQTTTRDKPTGFGRKGR